MGKYDKLLERIVLGGSDASIRFEELRQLLRRLGFVEKVRGSHHLFRHPKLRVRLNLQARGSNAKPYQVQQVRRAIIENDFGGRSMNTHYKVLVAWSPDDRAFVAQVPDLPGCMAHGETEATALESARQAIELYVDDLRECGEPVPVPREYQLLSA